MNEKTNDTRLHVLDVGFTNSEQRLGRWLSQLLEVKDVPKDRLLTTNRKEQFGSLIQHYFENYINRVETLLVHGEGKPLPKNHRLFLSMGTD